MPNRLFARFRRGPGRSSHWLIAGFAGIALVLTAISVAAIVGTYHETRRQAEISAGDVAAAMASELANRLHTVDVFLQQMARQLDTDSLRVTGQIQPLFEILERTVLQDSFSGVMVLNQKGSTVYEYGLSDAAPVTLASSSVYAWHIPPGDQGVFVSEPMPGGADQHLYISREIVRPDGSLAGLVVGVLNRSRALEGFQNVSLRADDMVMLVRTDGELLAHAPHDIVTGVDPARRGLLQERYTRRPVGVLHAESVVDGVERVHAYRQVAGFPLVMVVGQQTERVFALWRTKAALLAALAVLLDLALIGLILLLRRDIVNHRRAHRESLHNAALFRGALRGAGIGTALHNADGTILHANPALCHMLGYKQDELLGTRLIDYAHPDSVRHNMTAVERLKRGEIDFLESERQYVRKDGTVFWGLLSLSVDRSDESGIVLIAQLQDIDDRKRAEQARDVVLRQLNEATAALHDEKGLLQVTLDAIADSVITTDTEGRVRFMNPAAEATTGWTIAAAYGQPLSEVAMLYDLETELPLPDIVMHCLSVRRSFREDAALRDRTGVRREIEARIAPMRGSNNDVPGVVLVYQDVTEARVLQRELLHFASHDALTGLPNRSAFQVRVDAKLREARETGSSHVLVHVDLDRFKIINDTAGNVAGDACLRQVAAMLRTRLRQEDFLARLGSDEFGILLTDCHIDQARPIVERLVAALSDSAFPWEDRTYDLTVSAGATEISPTSDSVSVLMSEADIACYSAKTAGRGRASFYRPGQSDVLERHRELHVAADLRQALNDERFLLYAQRIFSCNDANHLRYEILVRMKGEEDRVVAPATFIPAAEQYDMMADVDRWVLRTCLRDFGARVAAIPGMRLHFNLSANSLNDSTFLEDVIALIRQSPIPVANLTFEITETALVGNMSHATAVISALRHLGCEVALDDFGIGLSSFSYLRTFPVDLVKIDGSFICNMSHSVVDRSIAQSIHRIAEVLGARTIAEAVEDQPTFEVVKSLHIEFAQGYGLHRPEPLDAVLARHQVQVEV